MLSVLINAGKTVLTWVLGNVVLKGVVLTAVSYIFVILAGWLWSLLPSYMTPESVANTFVSIPPGVWWWLDLVGIGYGAPLLIGAAVVRFLIRRIPVVG